MLQLALGSLRSNSPMWFVDDDHGLRDDDEAVNARDPQAPAPRHPHDSNGGGDCGGRCDCVCG